MSTSTSTPSPFTLGTACIDSDSLVNDSVRTNWLELRTTRWFDEEGKPHDWEYVQRKRTRDDVADVVFIIALILLPDGTIAVPIVIQYRPPLDSLVVEFPAGFVELGETEVECALRELYEETGLGKTGEVEVVEVSANLASEAGITNSKIKRIEVIIRLDDHDDLPKIDHFHENEEHIVTGLVSLDTFPETIENLAGQPRYIISSGVSAYATGLRHQAATR